MAYSLSSERPLVAAHGSNPVARIGRAFVKTVAARRHRLAMAELLEFDDHQLRDIGVTRHDIFAAIESAKARTR